MAASALGVVFSNLHEENVPELVRKRTIASIPYGGRYRIIDFILSNMVNSDIMTVGIMTSNNYRSLIDHIGSGKDWDLARKDGGLILLPPFSDRMDHSYTTRMEALKSLRGFLGKRKEKYVILHDADGVAKLDISKVLEYHEEKKSDITLVTHRHEVERTNDFMIVSANEEGRVVDVKVAPHLAPKTTAEVFINVFVINRQFLLDLVEDAVVHDYNNFGNDIILRNLNSLKIYRYEFKGYYASMDSMSAYFKHNMNLLKKEIRDELFGERNIYTKVRDSAPSKYGENANVHNSLISDGCEIEGVVENSILFRGVKVAKGAVIKNSIIMQDNIIGSNVSLNCVITDKNVVITDRRQLSGCEELPFYIQKGSMI